MSRFPALGRSAAAIVALILSAAVAAYTLGLPRARPPSPGAPAEALLRAYVPELRIGTRVRGDVRRRLKLRPAAYLGLRDSTYRGPDGVRGLDVRVDEYVDDGAPRVSWRARVESVYLEAPDETAATRVERRARRLLGAPAVACLAHEGAGAVLRRLWWAGDAGRGVALTTVVAPLPTDSSRPWRRAPVSGGARLAIGIPWSEVAWETYARPVACP